MKWLLAKNYEGHYEVSESSEVRSVDRVVPVTNQSGLQVYTNRLTKNEFLDCLYDVINGESYQSLSERVPYKVPFLSTKLRALAKEIGLETELNESLYIQCVTRARINGNPHLRKSK